MDRLELGAFTGHFNGFADGSGRADGFETEGAVVSWPAWIPCGSVLLWHSQLGLAAKTQSLGSRDGAAMVQVWSSWVYPTMTGLEIPFCIPRILGWWTSCHALGGAMMHPWSHYILVAKSRFDHPLGYPIQHPNGPKKTRKNHEKPWRLIPWTSHLFPWKNTIWRSTEATSRSSAVPTVCWSTIAATCARLGRRAEESSSITPRRWRAFDSYVAW